MIVTNGCSSFTAFLIRLGSLSYMKMYAIFTDFDKFDFTAANFFLFCSVACVGDGGSVYIHLY